MGKWKPTDPPLEASGRGAVAPAQPRPAAIVRQDREPRPRTGPVPAPPGPSPGSSAIPPLCRAWADDAPEGRHLRVPVSWVYRQGRRLKAGHSTAIPLLKFGKYLRIPTAALFARLQGPDTAARTPSRSPTPTGTSTTWSGKVALAEGHTTWQMSALEDIVGPSWVTRRPGLALRAAREQRG
jgi:hypothetical protein